jgi:hypothetical protein
MTDVTRALALIHYENILKLYDGIAQTREDGPVIRHDGDQP